MDGQEEGVSTEVIDHKENTAEKTINELEVLDGRGREYAIGGKKLIQKPLVLRDFSRLFEHIIELISSAASTEPELMRGMQEGNLELQNLTPERLAALAHLSSAATEKLYDIVALLLRTDKEFLLDNMELPAFSEVLADAFELNDLKEVIQNFQRLGSQVRGYYRK